VFCGMLGGVLTPDGSGIGLLLYTRFTEEIGTLGFAKILCLFCFDDEIWLVGRIVQTSCKMLRVS